jgi:hypothetical protein
MHSIIKEISKVLLAEKVEHYPDPILKAPDTHQEYYRIHNKRGHNIFSFFIVNDKLHSIVIKSKPPARIKELYGIIGKKVPFKYKNHYIFEVPIEHGLINGKHSISEKKEFFIDIARER